MKKRIQSLLLAFLMLVSIFPADSTYAAETEGEVTVWYFNSAAEMMEEADTVELYRGGELYLSAFLRDDISGNVQWQIEAGQDFWVDIQGGTAEDLRVSYGMVKSLLDNDAVRMRCAVSANDDLFYSDAVTVTVTDVDNRAAAGTFTVEQVPAAPDPLPAPMAITDSVLTDEDVAIYTITIEYVYSSASKYAGQRVALPYIAEVAEGGSLNQTITSPNCVGYAPDMDTVELTFDSVSGNMSYTVEYSPAEVSYTVRHYQQNINDDEYTWVDTTLVTGYTESLTNDAAENTYTGFTALSHYQEEIAANSSTTIDIYYDRNYYLISFELDGGHGVEAVYARYGADISVPDPQKAGYSFKTWSINGIETNLPTTMPAENRTYTALWTAGNTTYTVAYWLENPDADDKYDFVGSVSGSAESGTLISGSDTAVNNGIFTSTERPYYNFNTDKTDANVVIAGDGSTVVNVYYDRNEYTLKFYYARFNGNTYQVATNTNGSSASGGTVASASWNGSYSAKPELDAAYIDQTEVVGGYTYYYFTLTAKYGANLEAVWPGSPLSNAADSVKFVSWGTQYGSGYHTNNSNKNIKGLYSLMDEGLLIDPSVTADVGVNHWMVGYWGPPTMYTYEIYYTLLAGETADRTYNNVAYKKITQYTVGSTDTPSGQSNLSFKGVTYVGKDYDNNNKYDGNVIRFYYQRSVNSVTFDDNYGGTKTYSIPYGGTLKDYIAAVPTPDYPTELPAGAYVFDGWYQSKEGMEALDTAITMPNEDLIYYAKWSPKYYTVKIYSDSDIDTATLLYTENVQYGSNAKKPADLESSDNSTFVGWFYLDEQNEEQRFDFDNMTITQDITVYAKWRSNVMKKVTVRYIVENDDGSETEIADTETLMLRVGSTRTFDAKTGISLYEGYRTGCFPTTASHSITPTADQEEYTFDFVYVQYEAVPYKVQYKVMMADGTLRAAYKDNGEGTCTFVTEDEYKKDSSYKEYVEEHDQNDKAVVTQLYIPDNLAEKTWTLPDDYVPNALKIQKIIVPGENNGYNDNNTIIFIYRYAPTEALYTVNHYIQNATDTNVFDLYSYKEYSGTIGETGSASPISIPGYTYSHSITQTRMGTDNTLTEGADGNADVMSGTINTDDSLELNFYYEVNPYPYQVMYLEEGTNRVLAPTKTIDANGAQLTGLYGAKVTETYVSIDGYDVDAERRSIYIQQEAGDAASINTITFYYTQRSAGLVISKEVAMDEEQAKEEGITQLPDSVKQQEFEYEIYSASGFPKSVYDYTITHADGSKTDGKALAGTRTMTVNIKGGESILIKELPLGDYTVTETYVVGFRASVSGTIAQEHNVTLADKDETVTLPFLNTYPFYTGDLVIMKKVAKLADTDPGATEPYKVTVTLRPDDAAREIDRVITWTDGDGADKAYTIPALTGDEADTREFTFDVLVPVSGEVKLVGTPAGTFTVEEKTRGTGYITDYYKVTYNKALHQNDEATGTNHIVSGEIHGGHPTAVTFTNTYKKGTLTINKTVTQEYVNDSWQSDTFTFQITGSTELPDGEYIVANAQVTVSSGVVTVKDTNGNDPTITITKSEAATSWTGSLTFDALPAGIYTVKETTSDAYTCTPESGEVANLKVGDADVTADFTNTYKRTTGNLQVGKQIVIVTEGSIIDTNQEFTFEVTLKDTSLSGSFASVVKSTNGTDDTADDTDVAGSSVSLTADADGRLTFNLKHNQYILIQGLPVGDYLVKELAVEGYDSSFGDVNDGNQYSVVPATIKTNETTVLNCQNAYPVYYANLIVSKTVVTPDGHSAVDKAPADDVFTYTIAISNYSNKIDLTKGVSAKFYDSAEDDTPETKALTVMDDKLTFQLKHGQWVDLNLPACEYTIQETGMTSTVNTTGNLEDHYTVTYTVGDTAGVDGASYALVSGERETVQFTNTYKRHYVDLTIKTTCADNSQSFIFDVFATGTAAGDISLQVALVGNDSQTIKDLPVGTYTVIEQNAWSWRENEVGSQTVELTTQSVEVPFDFEAVDRIYWLSGYSYNIKRKKGGS